MPLCRYDATLWSESAGITGAVNGTSKQLRGATDDDIPDGSQSFGAVFTITATGGTSPTVDAKVQHSFDGTVWEDLVSMTQMTAAGTKQETKALSAANPWGRYLRVVVTPGGTAAPTVTGTVRIVSPAILTLS